MSNGQFFRRIGIVTIIAVYVLILVGGIVRATGAGMGCPDWPKCFGMWVPPTDISQLPVNYGEIFGEKLRGEVIFNPVKTWTEYVNRLVGVLIGFFIFATFIAAAITYRKKDKTIVLLSFLTFLLVGFEGWLGSVVVSTELHTGMITLHMLLSLVIVGLLMYVVVRSYGGHLPVESVKNKSAINFLLIVMMVLTTGQILLGTQVREVVDVLTNHRNQALGENWLSEIGGKLYGHVFLAVVLLGIHIVFYRNIKSAADPQGLLNNYSKYMLLTALVEFVSGGVLGLMDIPAVIQPVHLTFGVILLGFQFVIMLLLNSESVSMKLQTS